MIALSVVLLLLAVILVWTVIRQSSHFVAWKMADAIRKGDGGALQDLLTRGRGSINTRYDVGVHTWFINSLAFSTRGFPLSVACEKGGSAAAVRLLLEHGAKARFSDWGCPKPLLVLLRGPVTQETMECVRLLLEHGADPAEGYHGYHPVLEACWSFPQKYIREEGRYEDAYDEETARRIRDIVLVLISAGADPAVRDKAGHSAMTKAVSAGNPLLIQTLLGMGLDLNERDKRGRTPLFSLADSRRFLRERLEFLLANGADTEARDDAGMTALDAARERENSELIALLERG